MPRGVERDLTIAYADVRVMSRNLNENGPTDRTRASQRLKAD